MAIPCDRIIELIRTVAPEENAANWDNVGLQCGDPKQPVAAVVLALDVRVETVEFAIEREAGLIVSHHGLIGSPLKRIDPTSSPGRELTMLLENGIALYVAHTNVDASPVLSMNATIGKRLPLKDFGPVAAPLRQDEMKLVTFIPKESVDAVRAALSEAGAGTIGEYTQCSFSLLGRGTFRGGKGTNPAIGEKGRLEEVEEFRMEMVCPKNRLDRVLTALWDSHPYEEVAYDLYPVAGYKTDLHFLWRGETEEAMTLSEFALAVKHRLGDGIAPVKFAGDPELSVREVAWCSGGGKGLIPLAGSLGVDVYLTGDTGHHDGLDSLSRGLALVDLDHYYTEHLFVENVRGFLAQELEGSDVTLLPDPVGPVYKGL
jgi:dinuclear metal center YbgI/SA1388 family protein